MERRNLDALQQRAMFQLLRRNESTVGVVDPIERLNEILLQEQKETGKPNIIDRLRNRGFGFGKGPVKRDPDSEI